MRVLLDVVAPSLCVSCGVPADAELCRDCAEDVVALVPPWCERCGAVAASAPGRCAECRDLRGFRWARSLVAYAEPARSLTLALKRRGRRPLARAVGGLVAELASANGFWTGDEVVTFVPAGRRARVAGFDHVELIARAAASALGASLRSLLVRAQDGPRQADVSFAERRSNVRQRFAGRPTGGRVILVDDVFTTGSTAEACSLALLAAGAASVDVVTWARTLLRRPRSPGRDDA